MSIFLFDRQHAYVPTHSTVFMSIHLSYDASKSDFLFMGMCGGYVTQVWPLTEKVSIGEDGVWFTEFSINQIHHLHCSGNNVAGNTSVRYLGSKEGK